MSFIFSALSFGEFFRSIETVPAILFVIGIVLLIAEIFVPGFGFSGGTGTALIIIGIIMTANNFLEAFILILILLAIVTLFLILVLRSAKNGRLSKKLVLRSAATREEGFSTSDDNSSLIGLEGVAATMLRPAGTGDFDGIRLDVVSEGEFIEPGAKIKIAFAQGRRIIVKPIK